MPETGLSPLRLVAWGLLALGGLLWIALLVRLIQTIWQRFQPLNVWARYAQEASPFRRRRQPTWGCLGLLVLLLLGTVLVGAGAGLLLLESATREYAPLPAEGAVVARVQCGPAGESAACTLRLEGNTAPYSDTIHGSRWEIVGEVVIWDTALEKFGLRSGYRLLRMVGRDAQDQIVQDIALPDASNGWGELASWLDNRLPFVQVRREVASGTITEKTLYDLRVSRAGFLLQEVEQVQP